MYSNGSPKVFRRKLFIQEYSCNIEHISGSDNHVADAFSRLCAISDRTEYNWVNELKEFAPLSVEEQIKRTETDYTVPASLLSPVHMRLIYQTYYFLH